MHSRLQDRRRVRVGIVGVGNCASSLVQGLTYYRDAKSNEPVPGLMNVDLGGYHISDIQIASAFDVHAGKVGRDVAEAIFASAEQHASLLRRRADRRHRAARAGVGRHRPLSRRTTFRLPTYPKPTSRQVLATVAHGRARVLSAR